MCTKEEDDEKAKFEKLIRFAEKYIDEHAQKYLYPQKSCYEFVQEEYKPEELSEDKFNEKLINKIALHLQNYNRRPLIINYMQNKKGITEIIHKNYDKDKIRTQLIGFLSDKPSDEINDKSILASYSEALSNVAVQGSYWRKLSSEYFQSAINYFNNFGNKDEIIDFLFKTDKQREKELKILEKVEKIKPYLEIIDELLKIKGISIAITCDILKECGCTNWIKPDVHINEIFVKEFNIDKSSGKIFSKNVIHKFYDLYNNFEDKGKTPYYIDKILWLCCSGRFYNHNILFTNMTRTDFLERFKEYYSKS